MKGMKKILAVCMLGVMVFMLTACGAEKGSADTAEPADSGAVENNNTETSDEAAETSSDDKLVIAACMAGNDSGFMTYVVTGMMEYQLANAPDVDLQVVWSNNDSAKQQSQVEQFIAQGVDAIILHPSDAVQGATMVDLAAENGIPLVTVNTMTESTNNLAHIGSNDIEAGRLQMERIIEVCGEDCKVAYIDASLGHSAQINRSIGYNEVLEEHPNVELVVHDTGNWSAEESMVLVENWLEAGKEFDAILCMADCQLTGVISAVENAELLDQIKLAGMDCEETILEAIKAGKVDCSIWQDGYSQGTESLRLAIAAAKGEEVEDYIIPFEVCNVDNIDEYIEKNRERNETAAKYF
ncbi:MAG: substrate-binding domain-containing protein [Butyrivibrio sp.]|nr:substrate-binding domain-containing protein [Butyrivibrio sp.]